jgi:hypothetical protein
MYMQMVFVGDLSTISSIEYIDAVQNPVIYPYTFSIGITLESIHELTVSARKLASVAQLVRALHPGAVEPDGKGGICPPPPLFLKMMEKSALFLG